MGRRIGLSTAKKATNKSQSTVIVKDRRGSHGLRGGAAENKLQTKNNVERDFCDCLRRRMEVEWVKCGQGKVQRVGKEFS